MNDADQPKAEMLAEVRQLKERVAELERSAVSLSEDRNLLHTLLDHLPHHIYFKDRDSRFTCISRSLAVKHGLTDPAKAIGMTDFDFFTEEHARLAFEGEQEIIRTGKPILAIVEKETWPDAPVSWVTTTKMPLFDPHGKIIGTFGISRDITDLKQAEDSVRESEAVYRSLVDSLTQNVYRKDLQGRVTFANRKYCETMKKPLADLMGKTDHDLFPADLAAKYVEDDRQVIQSGQPLELVEDHQLPSGETIYVQVVKAPVFDSQQRVVGTQGMFWDITEKKRHEETLVRLAAIVESTDDAIIGTTVDGIILSWNSGAERLYGYTPQEAIGKRIGMVIPPDLSYELDALRDQLLAGERITNFETTRIAKDGRRVEVSISVAPIFNADGRIVGISGITRDISKRERGEQAVQQLAAIVASSSEAIIGHTLDGAITTWNPAAEKLYGYSSAQAVGKSITMLSPEDRKDELFLLIGRVAREEKVNDFRTVHLAQDGRRLNVSLVVSPIIDPAVDKVTGLSVIARDAAGVEKA